MKSVCRILTLLMCTGFLSLSKAEIEWKEIGTSVPDLHPVLTFCIADNQKIYLGMENSFIYRSDNLGEDWIFCSWRDPVPVYESNDIVYLGVDSNGIVWAHAMEPMDCCEDGLWRSADHGMHWERMLENQYNDEWYIAVHSGGDLLYGFHDGISVIKTAGYWSDEGWEHILYYQAQNFGIQSLAINDQKHVFYAMTSYPAYVVDLPDAHYSGNLPNFYAKYTGIDSKDILYSCIDQKLNRSMDFLENWTDITPPEREVEYFCLDHRDYLFAGTDQGIYLSEDHGENWSLLGLQEFHITHISVNASGNIVAGASNGGQLRVFLGVENPAIDFLGVLLPASEGYEIPMLEEFRIRWTHLGNVGNEIKIELYEDHVFKNTIAENTGNDGA
ncbi:hypothetical protein JW948_18080, partial [bacterium]|nr:hypothetical protein [bacterium]